MCRIVARYWRLSIARMIRIARRLSYVPWGWRRFPLCAERYFPFVTSLEYKIDYTVREFTVDEGARLSRLVRNS